LSELGEAGRDRFALPPTFRAALYRSCDHWLATTLVVPVLLGCVGSGGRIEGTGAQDLVPFVEVSLPGDARNPDATPRQSITQELGCLQDCKEMIRIPEGTFLMGCNDEVDIYCEDNEYPRHEVFVSEFWIDRFEVTCARYAAFLNAAGIEGPVPFCTYDCECSDITTPGHPYPQDAVKWDPESESWTVFTGLEDHAIGSTLWIGAERYCEWAGKHLCTEAQWEKAARGTDGRMFPWGNEPMPDCTYTLMQTDTGTCACGLGGLALDGECCTQCTGPADARLMDVSPFGVVGLGGNAREWVYDVYLPDYYSSSPQVDPHGPDPGHAPFPDDYHRRSTRGGMGPEGAPKLFRTSRREMKGANSSWTCELGSVAGFRCCLGGPQLKTWASVSF